MPASTQTIRQPYDIQRGTIRRGYAESARYSEAVDNHYMGSSEFEWGALPKSLRRMQAHADGLTLLTFPEVVDVHSNPLLALGNFNRIDPAEYSEAIGVVAHRKARTRERTGFADQMEVQQSRPFSPADVWWDINNDVMMSFDAVFMADLPRLLANSWAYMDQQAAA